MLGGRKVRSNKGKKRGPYRPRVRSSRMMVRVGSNGNRSVRTRKVRSNKGKKRTPYGPRTGKTRSGRRFRGGDPTCTQIDHPAAAEQTKLKSGKPRVKYGDHGFLHQILEKGKGTNLIVTDCSKKSMMPPECTKLDFYTNKIKKKAGTTFITKWCKGK